MSIYEKLMNIQQSLNAPKAQYSEFGDFHYRSCEDILEAVKPLLKENKCVLNVQTRPMHIGERYYIEAIATLADCENSEEAISVVASAREAEKKSKFDDAQLTGSTISYASKYALNGLFGIDDNKDADTDEYNDNVKDDKKTKAKPKGKITSQQATDLRRKIVEADYKEKEVCSKYKVTKLEDLDVGTYDTAMRRLQKTIEKKQGEE